MDVKEIATWASLLLAAIAILGHLKGFFSSGEKQLGERIGKADLAVNDLGTRLDQHERRIQSVEGELKHLPDSATIHRLELSMVELTGRLDVMGERLRPIEAIAERLQEALLEQAQR